MIYLVLSWIRLFPFYLKNRFRYDKNMEKLKKGMGEREKNM